jgi:hypothetical protein
MSIRNDEAIKIAEEIIDKSIDGSSESFIPALKLYYRLASLIDDKEEMQWAESELTGYGRLRDVPSYRRIYFKDRKVYAFVHENCRDLLDYAFTTSKKSTRTYMPYIIDSSGKIKIKPKDFYYDLNYNLFLNGNNFIKVLRSISFRLFKQTNRILNELKFSNIVEDIFSSTRREVDNKLSKISPDAIEKFISAYQNLQSNNKEDWANAVHSCRRILKAVADELYPPSDQKVIGDNNRAIDVGNEKYVNRLFLYIKARSSSEKNASIIGSNLNYIEDRLDSVYGVTNKGTHAEVTLDEARRYIIYTYLLIGDILAL